MLGLCLSLGLNAPPAAAAGGDTVSLATVSALIRSAHTSAGDGAYQGETSTAGFTDYVEATPNDVRTRVETWRAAGATGKIRILCDWDGIQDLSTASFRGPVAGDLTADAGEFGGYQRPAGTLWIAANTGRAPVFGNQSISVNGMPRVFFEGIGFAGQANASGDKTVGDGFSNVLIQTSATFPLLSVAAFKDCTFGLGHYRPTEATSEYVKAIGCAEGLSLHVEDCEFYGCRDQIRGVCKYLRVWNCHSHDVLSDFVTQFGFSSSLQVTWTGQRAWAWIEGNLLHNLLDEAGYNGLHTDLYQAGTSADVHAGNSALIRYNVSHQKTSLSSDSGTQGSVYSDDHTTAGNTFAVHDNINLFNAYNGAAFHDPSGEGHFFVEDNLFMRSGDWYLRTNGTFQDVTPRVALQPNSLAGSDPTANGGVVSITGNYLTSISNPDAVTITESGNVTVDPSRSTASGVRPENVFDGTGVTWTRDGSDTLSYVIANEDSVDAYTAEQAIIGGFEPAAGWGVDGGPADPSTWPTARSADVTAPTITHTTPADNATDVAVDVEIAVTFSEFVKVGTGNITLYDVTGTAVEETFDVAADVGTGAGTINIVGRTLYIRPTADLTNSNEYAVQIAATAIDDLAGNSFAGITDTTTISFTTVAGGAATFSGSAANPLYFNLDNAAGRIPANTSGITVRFKGLQQTNPVTFEYLINGTSTVLALDVYGGDGSLRATVEDSAGNKALNAADLGVNLTASTPQDIILAASLPDDTLWITIDGATTAVAMTDTANEVFPTSRWLNFFATSSGGNHLDYTCESVELWYSVSADPSDGSVPAGSADWSVTGPQATAEADPNAVTV